ncbi:hypothetical protein LZ554_007812 [Drepanopeziza brunnea f. sp. 'monogermtubi']|nr:hypothetical protein LZ554_007812 [Drepanopeziza brunnea f. sp. 'monogermtubi']
MTYRSIALLCFALVSHIAPRLWGWRDRREPRILRHRRAGIPSTFDLISKPKHPIPPPANRLGSSQSPLSSDLINRGDAGGGRRKLAEIQSGGALFANSAVERLVFRKFYGRELDGSVAEARVAYLCRSLGHVYLPL